MRVLKKLAQIFGITYLFISAWAFLDTIGSASMDTFNGHESYKVADNVSEYFNHLAQQADKQSIGSNSDIHLVVPVQLALDALGYDLGSCKADGIPGTAFHRELCVFQKKNSLKETGRANKQTMQALTHEIMADEKTQQSLDNQLIKPYQNQRTDDFMNSLGDAFAWYAGYEILLRPDLFIYAAFEMVYLNKFRESASTQAFLGCSNNHQRDAFRHSSSVIKISDFPTGSSGWAVTIADLRERGGYNPLPIKLMDMYNHRIAADLAEELESKGYDLSDSDAILVQAINDGKFARYPLPLVPKA